MDLLATPPTPDAPLTGEQKAWIAGYLAGLKARPDLTAPAAGEQLLILYGTQSGNAEWVAVQAQRLAANRGLVSRVADMDEVGLADLAQARKILVVVSTYGEGEMPDDAAELWRAVASTDAPSLAGVEVAVCGLGDSSYDGFCQTAINLDTRFAELGAKRVVPRAECDVDFQPTIDVWLPRALDALAGIAPAPEPAPVEKERKPARKPAWGRRNPYPAVIVANSTISGTGSAKEVRHIEISLGDSGIVYEPGDGLSVVPVNDPAVVDLLLARLNATGDEIIADRRGERTLRDALTTHYEISTASKYLVDYVASRSGDAELTHLSATGDREALEAWLWGRDVLDVLNVDESLTITPEELLGELRPLAPRAYSIASSPATHGDTVHITMGAVRYRSFDRDHGGCATSYLADRRAVGDEVGVFITPNRSFRLPDDDVPIIMIGPGTGIAPFRSFLHERAARGATGENWLFFGDQRRAVDFAYEEEIEGFVAGGVLTRLDLAFSRDQDHKDYVQHRMHESGADFFAWLERGARVYVCGDATRMAHDVDEALHEIVARHGGFDEDGAAHYVDELKKDKRYLRDVY
ncbi:NADPH--sulfite reductase flavoprotein alpha-component [Gordonia araii NBRC 100433]|uniref:assimilatory sulfite reductase (NADPH) n=2 Tax=Gordonia araii TaxID=263909 RepID=G7H6P7_9ACTN|nr:sulfite reductase subunit alpha [Gordonia araii NBRC 100433]GAB11522.1 NADPH--sulfite reductase flavoprotein alpha-component [Gordonia araii NBRC 100433]